MRCLRIKLWALVALALSQTVYAADPVTYPQQGVQVFLGLDDTSAPTQVQDGRAQDLQNVTLDISRSLRQRHGFSLVGDTIPSPRLAADYCAVTGLFYTKFSSGTERIVGTCGNRAVYLDGSSWTTITPTDGSNQITAGQNNQFVITVALDNLILTNDVDAPLQWAGGASDPIQAVGFTGLTNPIQKAGTVVFFKNYLIFGNTVENDVEHPTRFRWSNVGTINTWTDADFIDIGALAGQELIAFSELYDNLYVFFTDSIYKVSLVGGDDVFQVSKVTDNIGSVSKNSVQEITLSNSQNGLIFLDKDKQVFFFNGIINQDISGLITTVMDGLSGSRLRYAVSADTGTDYLLCVTSGTGSSNNLCLDFEYEIGEWTKHTNINANALARVLDSNVQNQVYAGTYKGHVLQVENADLRNDVGSASGTVDVVSQYATNTASSLQVLYDNDQMMMTGALVGAPIELTGGTGIGLTGTIADNTQTGLVVTDAFGTTPDTTTTYEVGAIDSYYVTKWYDMGESARLKHFGEIYFWGEADVSSTHALSYATDFNANVETLSLNLSASTSDAIWGSAIWGVSLWGSVDDIFRQGKLQTQGRYLRLRWAEDDLDELFSVYGWIAVYWLGDVL